MAATVSKIFDYFEFNKSDLHLRFLLNQIFSSEDKRETLIGTDRVL